MVEPPEYADEDAEEEQTRGRVVVQSEQHEYKWWHETVVDAVKRTIKQRKEQATKQVEHDRYLKALRALISEKGGQQAWGGSAEAQEEWRDRLF